MRKSKALLVSLILGLLYAIYLIVYFFDGVAGSQSAGEAIGSGIATMLVMPHMICTVLAVIFNAVGYFQNKKGFALTGGILYSVAAVVFVLYAPFVCIQIVFSFIGYARVSKRLKQQVGREQVSYEY